MLFKNATIFTADAKFVHGYFYVEDGRFGKICLGDTDEAGTDLGGAYVIPGLVDIHNHGCMGADFSDGEEAAVETIARHWAKCGVTSFAGTTMTLPYDVIARALAAGNAFKAKNLKGCARLMGAHMEGPFFCEKKKGAQNGDYLRLPDYEAFRRLYDDSNGLVRIVDVAPELEGTEEFVSQASKLCTVSLGHTDAHYDDACAAMNAGASHLTHMFNCMPGVSHRNPGPIEAAAERDNVRVELISDGFHVYPTVVRLAFKIFGRDKVCLISDALRCCGMPYGQYELGGQEVFLNGPVARLADGTVAGAATNLYDGMRNAVSFGIAKEEAILAATLNPAKEMGCEDRIGSIEEGKYADFVVCNEALEKQQVYIGGELC